MLSKYLSNFQKYETVKKQLGSSFSRKYLYYSIVSYNMYNIMQYMETGNM